MTPHVTSTDITMLLRISVPRSPRSHVLRRVENVRSTGSSERGWSSASGPVFSDCISVAQIGANTIAASTTSSAYRPTRRTPPVRSRVERSALILHSPLEERELDERQDQQDDEQDHRGGRLQAELAADLRRL